MNELKNLASKILQENGEDVKVKDVESLKNYILERLVDLIMVAEREGYLEEHLGETKGNGYYNRGIRSREGELQVNVPRTRDGKFRPKVLPGLYQRHSESLKDLILHLLANGNNVSHCKEILHDMGVAYSPEAMQEIVKNIKERVIEFQSRELPSELPFVYLDGKWVKIKEKGKVRRAIVYIVAGINFTGEKEILGFYVIFGGEKAREWSKIFDDLYTRGLHRIALFITDDLTGIEKAIKTSYPLAKIQKCYNHLLRNVDRKTMPEDGKMIKHEVKCIRDSIDREEADIRFQEFIGRWKEKYPRFVDYLEKQKEYYLSIFDYPLALRPFIRTTNMIESINKQIKKIVVKQEGYFQSLDSMGVYLYSFFEKLHKRWQRKPNPVIRHYSYEIRISFNKIYYQEKEVVLAK